MNLVIVESPAKAKTIGKFLGKNYKIKASMGHLVDLPKSQLGIEVDNNFSPKYITIRGKGKILQELREANKKANYTYLATDPDREGEAISWHLCNSLGINEEDPCRVEFHEITNAAVKEAFSKPRPIEKNRVNAQQARRILDRLVGYLLSPLLWEKVRKGLSAGRVQSVALRLICEREREIESFEPEEYWSIDADLQLKEAETTFTGKFYGSEKEKISLRNREDVDNILDKLEGASYSVKSVKSKKRRRNPPPPFITSTLQQEASRKLGFTTKKTMRVAQQLYEGLEIGENKEPVGLITYIRTDATRISTQAQEEAWKYIKEQFGKDNLPQKPKKYAAPKGAQEAHEAIRPTYVNYEPKGIKSFLSRDQHLLYKLIWERFIASQMASAVIEQKNVEVAAGGYIFKATGSTVDFAGFMVVYTEEENGDKENDKQLPLLEEGQELKLLSLTPNQHFTQPPPRFSEASLVKTMENRGIGRPSTYSPTIETIQSRGYVVKEDKVFKPTELGFVVVDLLKEFFPEIIDVSFTVHMEEELDKVESGEISWIKVLNEFYQPFKDRLKEAEKKMEKVQLEEEETEEQCPVCGKNLVKKHGRYGQFLACPGFPDCRYTMSPKVDSGVKCPECGGDILERRSKKGKKFYGCSSFPDCRFVSWNKPVDAKCPECGYFLVEKKNKSGSINYHCSNKECDYKEKNKVEKST